MVTVQFSRLPISARGVSVKRIRAMSEEETVKSQEQQQGATQEADPGSQEKVDGRPALN